MILTYMTCKDKAQAKEIAKELLQKQLIACANIFPITSLYYWQDHMEESEEVVLIAKTTNDKYDSVVSAVKDLHSYDIPCVLKLPVTANEEFFKWVYHQVEK